MRNLPKRPFGTVVTKRNVGFAVYEFGRVALEKSLEQVQ